MIFEDLSKSKILIIYVYYQRKNEQKNQTNLAFFLKYGLDNTKWKNLDITTVLVIDKECEVTIPKNIHVIYSNSLYYSDYEGWYDGIEYIDKQYSVETYDYLCLMNCSTFGPVMEEDKESHWLYPFYDKMVKTYSIACSPYMNNFNYIDSPLTLSCHFTMFKMTKELIPLLVKNNVIGKKVNKLDAIQSGEEGLSATLLNNKFNICSLFYDNERLVDFERREFEHSTNIEKLTKTIFIKNIWRIGNYQYASRPVLYHFCNEFLKQKLNIKEFKLNTNEIDFSLMTIDTNYYYQYVYAEELIVFPIKGTLIKKSCVIYAHYDKNNQLADYVIKGLKTLIYLGYDILFFTTSSSLNIDLSILPFKVHFIKNEGMGTDYKILLLALKYIKRTNLNFDWIMFMNCSLLFPIHGILNFLNTVLTTRKNCDFWGHWESHEVSWHLVGVPFEFKSSMIKYIIIFLDTTIPICNFNFVNNIETKISLFLKNLGFTYNVVIPLSNLGNVEGLCCPTHNPNILSTWIHDPKSFAVKWKYVISYLDSDVSCYLNDLTKFLYYGENNSIISKGEGSFPSPKNFKIFDWEYYLDSYPDLKQAGIKTKEQAVDHWLKYGRKENRICIKQ